MYKSLRLLLASIHNSHQIDQVCRYPSGAKRCLRELRTSHLSLSHFLSDVSMINVGFYSILSLIVLSIVGVDIHVIIMGLGSIAVSLAFMIGPATSRAFEV